MNASLREALDDGPMSRFQWTAIGVCVLLNTLDGFDVLVMAFTGKSVSGEWDLSAGELGLLLSGIGVVLLVVTRIQVGALHGGSSRMGARR